MHRFSSAARFAHNRLLEGETLEEVKRDGNPLCALLDFDTRCADGAIEKAGTLITLAEELGQATKRRNPPIPGPCHHYRPLASW